MPDDPLMRLGVPREKITAFQNKWRIAEISMIGSMLRGDFRPDSDVDFLITFEPDVKWSLLDYVHMEDEMADIVGRPVDMIERRAVESSENYIRRRGILEQPHSLPRIDEALLLDILLAGRRALGFMRGVKQEEFSNDEVLQGALLHCLGTVGLATRKLSSDLKGAHPEVPWATMMHVPPGSRLWSHTSEDRLWETVTNDLPVLIAAVEPLVPPDEGD
jgi:uncharacterized protein